MTDVNTPSTADIQGEVWAEGDLPSQGFGEYLTLLPGADEFTLPANLAQLWDEFDVKDSWPKSKTFGQTVKRHRIKFTKEAPLVIASGPKKGDTLTATVSGVQRPRGKKDDEATPWVSDLAYLLEIGLNDKSRPTTAQGLKAAINKYAGKTVRIEHGLSAHCRADKVRYIITGTANPNFNPAVPESDANPRMINEKNTLDPSGKKGCGDDSKQRADGKGKQGRYYTKDFKDPETGEYMDTIECDCGAVLRGFPSIERFLPPIGAK